MMDAETLLALIVILVALILLVEIYRAFADHNLVIAAKGVLDSLEKHSRKNKEDRANRHDDIAELLDHEKYEEALAQIGSKLANRPADARLFWFKGRTLFLLGRKAESVEAFQRSLALEPGYDDSIKPYLEQLD